MKRLYPIFFIFLTFELITRIALLLYTSNEIKESLREYVATFMIGLCYDLLTFVYFSIPFSLLFLLPGFKKPVMQKLGRYLLYFLLFYALLFSSISEFLFWDEFHARFNFIAVDYLVYTQEVIGNIRESYPLPLILSLLAIIAVGFTYLAVNRFKNVPTTRWQLLLMLLLPVEVFYITPATPPEILDNRYLNEISKNGIYSLFSAFRNNTLNYQDFYITKNKTEMMNLLCSDIHCEQGKGITRLMDGDRNAAHPNVFVITVESMSAEFMERFGNKDGITPNLDALAKESLSFTNIRAIGTRTVYGLAAVNLSIPPVPGNSIVRRPNNENLFTLATVFNTHGYDSKFFYGGFGYFDNMNYFFSNNGYKIVDRSDMSGAEISFANIWGVCDEDLFQKVIKEADASFNAKKPFFSMVMTTTNHRPYTYPDGKIDIPSHTGRNGGVKYSDYAIGEFIRIAKTKPWFKNTVFVITADHTASSAGKTEISPNKYHIPLLIYYPNKVMPKEINILGSQIDTGPTLFGVLGFEYESKFFGHDLNKATLERAFISNYQKLGLLTNEGLTILKPIKEVNYYQNTGKELIQKDQPEQKQLDLAISYFQSAADWGLLSSTRMQSR